MPTRDDRITAYIARSAPFARPILEHLRAIVHEACPDVEETIKWGFPHFTHGGRILAGMSAFKQHAAFAVPMLGATGDGAEKQAVDKTGEAMGHYGRITAISDLPSKRTLIAQLKQAAKAIDAGAKRPGPKKHKPKPPLQVPDHLTKALSKNPSAKAHFGKFPPSKQRDYIEWIVEAKREETRERRVAQSVEWIAEGKGRNWKYEKS
ncbi:YdeI/OmpD-associated family protein [Luteimonas panaciterrae]|uniref:YdeI/OmpD-associated family protein n=1 Tax=Luteimonas panaciterrae TaxID=363885 RepID=UPI001CF9EA4E|nr:YdeI/OmpD-associated family protein [Luteimonas panaciterrae]